MTSLTLTRWTERDPSLVHQVVFLRAPSANWPSISCNCLQVFRRGQIVYVSMGETQNLNQSRVMYNNPDNHRTAFREEDRARW